MARIGKDLDEFIVGPAPHRVERGPSEPDYNPVEEPIQEPAAEPVESPDREQVPAGA